MIADLVGLGLLCGFVGWQGFTLWRDFERCIMTIETVVVGAMLLYGMYQLIFTIGYLLRHKWRLRKIHKAYLLAKAASTTSS